MKFPFERWLKFLLQFTEFSNDEIQELCRSYGFAVPHVDDLKALKREIRETRPKHYRKGTPQALKWVRDQGLWGMYTDAPVVVAAKKLTHQHRLRQTIEYLLAANTKPTEVADYLQQALGDTVDPDVISAYSHYFWDVNSLAPRQWTEFCREQGPEGYVLSDIYQLRSAQFALWKLGHRVELDRVDTFKAMFHESTLRFMDTSRLKNGQGTALSAKAWADIAFAADDRLAGTSDKATEILRELKDLKIALGRRDISSIEELKNEKPV